MVFFCRSVNVFVVHKSTESVAEYGQTLQVAVTSHDVGQMELFREMLHFGQYFLLCCLYIVLDAKRRILIRTELKPVYRFSKECHR